MRAHGVGQIASWFDDSGTRGEQTDGRRRRAPVQVADVGGQQRAASRLVRRVPGRHAVTARVPTVFSSVGNYTSLQNLQAKYPGRIALVKCVSADVEGNAALAKEIEKRHGRLDTVIANAGMFLTLHTISKW